MVASYSSPRRTSAEVRELILEAATELFRDLGYDATRTRDIAERSGVAEPVIFRHFPSKSHLFEEAIVDPFVQLIDDYVASWERTDATAEDLVREMVERLYNLLRLHRQLLLTLIGAGARIEPDPLAPMAQRISRRVGAALRTTEPIARVDAVERGYRELDAPATAAAGIGMIFAVALLDEWLFDSDTTRPDRERTISEVTAMILYGVGYHTPDAETSPQERR